MISKERTNIALRGGKPDRVPVFSDFVPEVKQALLEYFKTDDYYEMSVRLGNDMLMAGAGIGSSYYGEGEEYVCSWGCKWKYFRNESGRYTCIIDHPLEKDIDGSLLTAYQIPDPENENIYTEFKDLVKRYGETHFICGAVPCSIFEASWYLRGIENLIADMAIEPDYANALMDKVMEFPLKAGLRYIKEGAAMIWLGDDVGMQSSMLMSPAMWREYLKPRMKKIIEAYKAENPDILVAYHSCGYIIPIIDDLIEIGLDVLNPIQPKAMDPARINDMFGKRLSFWGSICIQETLPRGTKEEIENEVRLRMETIGKDGGLLIGPAHLIQADTSVENVMIFYEAVKKYGEY